MIMKSTSKTIKGEKGATPHGSVFFNADSGLNEKTEPISPSTHSKVDGGILPAAQLYYNREATPLLSEYTDQHYSLLPATLIEQLLSNSAAEQKLISRLTSVQLQ